MLCVMHNWNETQDKIRFRIEVTIETQKREKKSTIKKIDVPQRNYWHEDYETQFVGSIEAFVAAKRNNSFINKEALWT